MGNLQVALAMPIPIPVASASDPFSELSSLPLSPLLWAMLPLDVVSMLAVKREILSFMQGSIPMGMGFHGYIPSPWVLAYDSEIEDLMCLPVVIVFCT